MPRVLLVADTHLTAGQAWRVVARLGDRLADADLIVHAGDITDAAVLRELERSAPVHAVRGNNDVVGDVRSLPERVRVDVDGCIVGVVHDTGPAAGRAARVRAQFPDVDVVVFGHSHVPWHETHVRSDGHVQHHVNPGSAMQARRQPHCTIAWLVLQSGSVLDVRHEIVHTPRRNERPAARRSGPRAVTRS